jgi:hypothetical protein
MISSDPIDLPSWSPGPSLPTDTAQGTLRWDGDCVRLQPEDEATSWIIVWPDGYRLREDLVPPIVVDGHDRSFGSLGDRVTLPGIAFPAGSWKAQRDRLIEDVPRACRDEALWFGVPLAR